MRPWAVWLTVVPLIASSALASVIVGAPFGKVTDAEINVPKLAPGQFYRDSAQSSFDHTYTVLVTGGTGTGLLNLGFELYATDVETILGFEEEVFASSLISGSINTHTQTPPAVTGCGNCNVPFTYGVPFTVNLSISSFVEYVDSLGSTDRQAWSGLPVESWVELQSVGAYDDVFRYMGQANIEFSDGQIPEPNTFVLVGPILIGVIARKMKFNQPGFRVSHNSRNPQNSITVVPAGHAPFAR